MTFGGLEGDKGVERAASFALSLSLSLDTQIFEFEPQRSLLGYPAVFTHLFRARTIRRLIFPYFDDKHFITLIAHKLTSQGRLNSSHLPAISHSSHFVTIPHSRFPEIINNTRPRLVVTQERPFLTRITPPLKLLLYLLNILPIRQRNRVSQCSPRLRIR